MHTRTTTSLPIRLAAVLAAGLLSFGAVACSGDDAGGTGDTGTTTGGDAAAPAGDPLAPTGDPLAPTE